MAKSPKEAAKLTPKDVEEVKRLEKEIDAGLDIQQPASDGRYWIACSSPSSDKVAKAVIDLYLRNKWSAAEFHADRDGLTLILTP